MRALTVGRSVRWPAAIASQAVGVLGMRGAGKSNLGRVFAEELFASSIPFVVFDPIGNWHGIRAGRDGRPGGGVPVPIFGGDHGDLPLDRSSGHRIADLVLDRRLSCVLDLSHADFSETDKRRFLVDFGDRLFRKKSRESGWLTLIMEEADDYAPQSTKGTAVLEALGMFQRLVKRGRFKGLGALMITQRSAAINKDLLYMVGTLIVFRTTGPRDQEAVAGWVKHNALGDELLASLPTLEDGEAWVIAPEALGSIDRVHFRRMTTFDTGATPEHDAGGKVKPATLVDIDVPALSKELAEAVERAKADDPRHLKAELQRLRAELAKPQASPARGATKPEAPPKRVEVPVLKDAQVKRLEAAADRIDRAMVQLGKWAQLFTGTEREVRNVGAEIKAAVAAARDTQRGTAGRILAADGRSRAAVPHPGRGIAALIPDRPAPRPVPPRPPRAIAAANGDLSGPEQRILDALAELEALGVRQPERIQVAILADYSNLNSKGFANALGALSSAGRISYPVPGRIALTPDGRALANQVDAPRTPQELQARVLELLGGVHARVLTPLLQAYPHPLDRIKLAGEAGYGNLNSKGFANALGRLRSLGFIDYPATGQVAAQPVLFLE